MSTFTDKEVEAFSLLRNFLNDSNIPYSENFDLSKVCHMRAGGICQFYISPKSSTDLEKLIIELIAFSLKYVLVGRLSNTLFRSGVIRTIVVSTTKIKKFEFDNEGMLHVDSGVNLPRIAKDLTGQGYTGFGGLTGFPASVGGAIYMNASCYGNAISDYLVSVRCLNPSGKVKVIQKKDLGFDWRYSNFHESLKGYVIVGATFLPEKGDDALGKSHLLSTQQNRTDYQERKLPNLGSTFATINIYGDIAKANKVYRLFYIAIALFSRLFRKKRDKVWAFVINKFTQRYFGIRERNGIGFSEKTMNCVVNKSGAEADEIIEFVYDVKNRIGDVVGIEIEIYDRIY